MHGRWKTHLAAVAMAALISACGGGSDNDNTTDNDNHGFGFSFDDEFNGLRVRYFDGGPHTPTAETIERWFQDTIACADEIGPPERAGLPVSPPLVIIVPMGENDPFDGKTWYDDTGTITIERQWADDRGLYVHEFVHWILHNRRVPFESNDNHREPEFVCRFKV